MRNFFILSILATSLPYAQVITVSESGHEMRYEVSCEELECHPTDGGVAHAIRIADQKTSARTLEHAAALTEGSGNQFDLVLYPVDTKPNKINRRIATRSILAELAPGTDTEEIGIAAGALSASIPGYAPNFLILDFANAGDSLSLLTLVRSAPGVISADPLLAKSRLKRLIPDDPRFSYANSNQRYQWHLKNTGQNGGISGIDANIESVWDNYLGNGVLIGIVDDGLEVSHPDLTENTNTAIDYDWNDSTPNDPTPQNTFDDHGTACAGVAAARGNNGVGGSGAAPRATLVGLRLIAGSVTDADEAEAMSWRSDLIQIKSNSWGPFDGQGTLDDSGPLVKVAFRNSVMNGRGGLGTIHVWAAGNGYSDDNVNYDGYASSIYTIAAGAVTDTGRRSNYSEPGASKLISAPSDGGGQGITTTTLTASGSYTDDFGGTSSATPLVSGVCALILEANPNLGWRDVQEILIQSAVKVRPNDSGWRTNAAGFDFNHEFGAGMIDAAAAVNLATDWENLEAQESIGRASGTLNATIPDNSPTGTSHTFDLITDPLLRVEHVTLTANITHPNRGHLTISLTSPGGTESFLSVPHSVSGANFSNWKMMTVHNWGEDSQGIWTLKVTDSSSGQSGRLSNATLEVFGSAAAVITDPPVFSHDTTTDGNVESPFRFNLRASNATTSYSATGLPAGLSLNETTGLITGVPTTEGAFSVNITATNIIGTTNGSLTINVGPRIPIPPLITGSLTTTGIMGLPFRFQIESTNSPTSYAVTNLPEGLTLNPTSGFISGTPTTLGSTLVTITVTNPDGSDTADLVILVIEPGSDPVSMALDTIDVIYETSGTATWALTEALGEDGDALVTPPLNDSENASFSAEFTGPGLVKFSWMISSEASFDALRVEIDGVQNASISGSRPWQETAVIIPAGQHLVSWTYEKDGSESEGQDRAWVDALSFTVGDFSRPLGDALDYPGLRWRASGNDLGWSGQVFVTEDGEDAAQAGVIGDNAESVLEVDLEGPGVFFFSYRVESEKDYDFLTFTIDGAEEFSESGTVSWTRKSILIPEGMHTLSWRYQKDGSQAEGSDTAWLDQVLWLPQGSSRYQQWVNLYFSPDQQADPNFGGQGGDPDGDGRGNLEEYALGSEPLVANPYITPDTSIIGNEMTFDYIVDTLQDDLIYEAETSSDLTNWEVVPSDVRFYAGSREYRRVTQPLGTEALFLRYAISLKP
ncbi:S8 family serine peptidase [Akkermansiaceae bacterium]|nr:S8 family serine peptidase [Akkermansiaceae bacterium]